MINYNSFRKEGYRSGQEVFELEIPVTEVNNETPISLKAFKFLESKDRGLDFSTIDIQLPDVITAELIRDIHENGIDRDINSAVNDGVLNFSKIKPVIGDRFRVIDTLKNIPNKKFIYELIGRYLYGNFMDNNAQTIHENTSNFIWSLSDFIIHNEVYNLRTKRKFSFPVIEESMKEMLELGLSGEGKSKQPQLIFDSSLHRGIASELVHQYHTLDFPIYDHTEKLLEEIISPYYKFGSQPSI